MGGGSFGVRVRTASPYAALFVAAAGIGTYLIRPFQVGLVGFDMTASVLYFDRIVAGRHLELFIAATPKPLFTVVYGVAHATTGDWRVISWLAIGMYALAVVLGVVLAARVAGQLAGGFAAVAFIGSVTLLSDASQAYAVCWALVGWLVAGLAVTAGRPRYGVAGAALLLATLARFETLILLGLIALVLVVRRVAGSARRVDATPTGPWLILIGLGALPVYMLHDWLLTGNAFYTESVPVIASSGSVPIVGPLGALRMIVAHYGPMAPLLVLAVIGVFALVHGRRWPILVGLAALGPGIVAFILFLGFRRIYISARYFSPADLAMLFSAAVGVASLRVPALHALTWSKGPWRHAPGFAIAGGLVALAMTPFAPLDPSFRNTVRSNREMAENLSIAEPTIERAVLTTDGGAPPVLLGPVLLLPQMAVDLGLPLTRLGATSARRPGSPADLRPGEIVYHDPRNDRPAGGKSILEVDTSTVVGSVRLDPLLVDHERRFWILRVTAA